ncbi:hypothetical protein EHQ16_09460 [Leptospira kanakyensis]|uniref:Uncharacterized protein n=2 Tax=Leptospira kanakyensis TaxID=2484968 RepID=A0A6N4Q8I2_9LEPT|nr:hypothetical protein EHQ11_01635 [Leptospira kanakyensis]TGK61109.1 hypothetical protein EHQ16_09460 [Leptospira kanakyensis]TGK76419.1 hypothetical protein EHQ18_00190 [Leptospira kanakyensis]
MPFLKSKMPFFNRIQWQTLHTIWKSLCAKEVIPFLFYFLKERFRLHRSTFGKEWKTKRPTNPNQINPIDLIAFYIAYKEVTSHERALLLLLKILKQQSAGVFLEMVEVFRRYGIKIL